MSESKPGNLIGITGGIGAGKSTVLAILAELGQRTLDSDSIVHELYSEKGDLQEILVQQLGPKILTAEDQIDRKVIAEQVFADAQRRHWLNQLLHPRVKQRMLRSAAAAAAPLFCAVPLLFEVGWDALCTRTIAVWCTAEQQQQRLRQRAWTAREIDQRLASQLHMDKKLDRADFGLINTSSLGCLHRQCQLLLERILT